MKCDKLTSSGGCTETADRVPCTARLCAAKNSARPAHLDTLKRLGDCGMSATVSYPFRYSVGEHSTLAQKRAVMEAYAETVIRHVR